MSSSNDIDLIFEEWKASLKSRDRTKKSVHGNFEDLFEEMKRSGIKFEDAHAVLPKAIKAHQPPAVVARQAYKIAKSTTSLTEKEFIDGWNEDIAATGAQAFFDVYPRPKVKDLEDDGEPKVFGNMTAKEYKAQRRYADQFPVLNTEELERKMLSGTYNPLEDISNILGSKDEDGNSN